MFPFLAHAPMEPLDAVFVKADDGALDIYTGAQFPGMDQATAAQDARPRSGEGAPPHAARRRQLRPPRAVRLALHAGGGRGLQGDRRHHVRVKHMWTREDDIRGGFYRPMYVHRMKGAIDADGKIVGLGPDHRRPVDHGQGRPRRTTRRSKARPTCPTRSANLRVISHNMQLACRRSGGARSAIPTPALPSRHSSTSCCRRPGKDPVEGRLALLDQRTAPCRRAEEGRGDGRLGFAGPAKAAQRGVAVVKSFSTYVAQIVGGFAGDDRRAARAQGLVRGRLRRAGQPERDPRADGGRRRLRPRRRAVRRDHARRGRQDRAVQLPRLPLAAHQRDAACRGGGHRLDGKADRRRRTRRPAGRPGRRQCLARADRHSRCAACPSSRGACREAGRA